MWTVHSMYEIVQMAVTGDVQMAVTGDVGYA